jgi:starch synthase
LDPNFKRCVEFREATADMLENYKDTFDFQELGKLAIDYSDGVIAASEDVSKDLLKYAAGKDIPVLAFPGEDFSAAYEEFYEKI